MNKKRSVLIFISIFTIMFLIGIISAQSTGIKIGEQIGNVVKGIGNFISPIMSPLLGETDEGMLFSKILLFIILVSIIWIALSRISIFDEYPAVNWTISIIVSILGIRYLAGQEWINTILLPYGTLGVAILAGLPFIIYFFVVELGIKPEHKTLRNIAWIFFAVIFIGMWLSQDVNSVGGTTWIYPVTAVLSLLMIFFDGTIQRLKMRMQMDKSQYNARIRLLDQFNLELIDLDKQLQGGRILVPEYKRRVHLVQKKIAALNKI